MIVINSKTLKKLAAKLAETPTTSTKKMGDGERVDGIEQMLLDLYQLAKQDGCISAAWAFEYLRETSGLDCERDDVDLEVFTLSESTLGLLIRRAGDDVASSFPYLNKYFVCDSSKGGRYLLKNGLLVESIPAGNESAGYWDAREQAEDFIEKWTETRNYECLLKPYIAIDPRDLNRGWYIACDQGNGRDYIYKDGSIRKGVDMEDSTRSFWETKELAEEFLAAWKQAYGRD